LSSLLLIPLQPKLLLISEGYAVVSLSFTEWLNSLMEIQGSMLQGKVQQLEEMGRGLIHQTAFHGFNP
jgi:hypothetical protein